MFYYMRKGAVGLLVLVVVLHFESFAQVDTSFVYNTSKPYGTLDIRVAKSSSRYYYLQENKTVSFRESSPGVKTNTYRDMTSWDSSPYGQGNMREKNGTADAFVMNYRLLYPNGYNPTYTPGYPLIVFIHGAGERANCWDGTCYHADASWNPNTNSPAAPTDVNSKLLNNDHNLLHGGSTHLQMRNAAGTRLPNDPALPARSFPGFVLFPQSLNGWNANSVQDAIKLVRLVAKKYNIDENRIYIEGLSNGGYGVYEALKRAPWLFAAATAMSAVSDASITYHNLQSTIAEIPLWTFQGGQDTNPTPSKTEGYVKKFRQAGMVVRYTLYSNLGHGTWNTAMKEPDYFKWMLSQSKANIHKFAGGSAICATTGQGVKMELSEGFRAYQWEKDGVIISGATTYTYTATAVGSYRARFSRVANPAASDWNPWSPTVKVTQINPPAPKLDQVGTVVLKDLNGYADAKLKADPGLAHYYWYKNGALLSIGDSVNEPIIKSTSGNGTYTLKTAGFENCISPASAAKVIFFNDSAPINLGAPGSVASTQPSTGSVRISWTDGASGESGYEVWRRKLVSGTTYTPWEMRALTAANITAFVDTPVEPSKQYNYKIRAVGTSGRSNYSPTNGLVVNTIADTQPPSAPVNLVASQAAIQAIKLTWQPSTDNSGIKQYRIYYGSQSVQTGSTATTFTITGLALNANYTFTVKAEDLGGNLSAASNASSSNTYVSGLFYEHSTGAWVDLDNINWTAPPEFSGKVTTFSISPRTQEDYFNFEFDGFLYINTGGSYQFNITSSDGSRLDIDGVTIINNDGIHAARTLTSTTMTLSSGPHRINVKYFEFDESHVITVRYKGPDTGNSMVTIPATALKSGNPTTTMTATSTETQARMATSTVTVYPNPTTENDINVQLQADDLNQVESEETPVHIKVVDFSGRQVFDGQFSKEEIKRGVKILPYERMKKGIYLMLINENGKVTQERISIKD
jgi:hypothetical protein